MATTTRLQPSLLPLPTVALRFLCESWWTCVTPGAPHSTWRQRSDCLLNTGLVLSVVPRTIRDRLDLAVTPVPGWSGQVPSWYGIPCGLGRLTVWLPVEENPGQYRDFSLLALLPRDDLTDAPPFAHLGVQFLLEYQAQLLLDCSSGAPGSVNGKIVIP
jgi:hypothetical protein